MKQHEPIELGSVFGRLTVVGPPMKMKGTIQYQCMCACGTYAFVLGSHLRKGHTRSCGCLQRECTIERNTSHGMRHTRLYNIWAGILRRCGNSHDPIYRYYGGRGITVCDGWQTFELFMQWAVTNGYEEGLTIERLDVNGNYHPENCTWISSAAQARNKRNTVMLTAFGETKCLPAWVEDVRCMVGYSTLYRRIITYGLSAERAIVTPSMSRTSQR